MTVARLQQALSGRYVIERELASGGMPTAWLASDLKHDRPVALTVLHRQLAALVGGPDTALPSVARTVA